MVNGRSRKRRPRNEATESTLDSQANNVKKLLVVGDWFLDEHWVIGIHRSATSSRTGLHHFRALHRPSSVVESLCGAGRTASILENIKRGGKPFAKITGIGLWARGDTGALAALLDPLKSQPQTPYTMVYPEGPQTTDLFNLGDLLSKEMPDAQDKNNECATTRIIRLYQQKGNEVELLQRLDWELPTPEHPPWMNLEWLKQENPLDQFITRQEPINAVVIKDMGKGVICPALVDWLAHRIAQQSEVPWFVSTKQWQPEWFKSLPEEQVKLIIVPQIAAQWAVGKGVLNRWITPSGDPSTYGASKRALEKIDALGRRFGNALIIVLPDGLSLLAREPSNDARDGVVHGVIQQEVGPKRLTAGMPMASVFLPAVAAHILNNECSRQPNPAQTDEEDKDERLKELIKSALNFTYKWMLLEVGRIEKPDEWEPSLKQNLDLDCSDDVKDMEPRFDPIWKGFKWTNATDLWKQAFSRFGIITEPGKPPRIELWRAMTDVDGYVCCMRLKRATLQKVTNHLGTFAKHEMHEGRSRSLMLIASPGSGKTFLVHCLADSLKLRPLSFNITQMLSKADLLDCFDTIVTSQAQNRGKAHIVFFDEINAKLDGQHVYDAFLAPLEEGVYIRAGKTFHIDPCIWVFAGTSRPKEASSADKSDKGSDFESRLSIPPLDLRTRIADGVETDEAQLEKVYLGVSLLRSVFPDVRAVTEKVLEAFHRLPPELETRELKHFVESFTEIQYGIVKAQNIQKEKFQELLGSECSYKDWEERLESEPHIEIRG